MKLSASVVSAILFAAVIGASPITASADRGSGHGGSGRGGGHGGGHQQFSHQQGGHGSFQRHGFARGHGGYWYHGHHGGRLGWWWVVGPSLWYYYPYYPSAVYPYPDSYVPPVVSDTNLPPPPQNWYYCTSAKTYYPYVPSCPEGWKTVPVTPDEAPPE